MTDAEKIAAYERIMSIIRDAIALEQNSVAHGYSVDTVDFNRADAFKRIVETAIGVNALPWRLRFRE